MRENIYKEIKSNISVSDAALRYGLKVNSSGMTLCPFHSDHHPSMKVDRRFHCFGCQADGDVIDFAARLFSLDKYEAALKLIRDFNLPYDPQTPAGHKRKERDNKHRIKERVRLTEKQVCRIYRQYLDLVSKWELEYSPKSRDEDWDDRFTEAMRVKPYIESILDILETGTDTERLDLIQSHEEEIKEIERRLLGCSTRNNGRGCPVRR